MPAYRRTAPRAAPPAATVRPSRRANARAAGELRGTRERLHDHRSEVSRSDTQVDASAVAHHDPNTRGPQRTRDPRRALPDPLLPSFPIRFSPAPRLRSPSPPVYLRSSDRFSWSFFMVLMLFSVPSCLPPPRLRPPTLHAWAVLPGVCLQVEEGGVQRAAVDTPFLESLGVERKQGRRRGGGPVVS